MIRSLLAVLKCGTKRLGAAAVGCVVATAGMLQGQSPESAPQLLPPSVQPTIAAPVTPTPATRQEGPVASSSVPIFDPMVKPASGCAGCGLPHRSGGGSGYPATNNKCVPGQKCNYGNSDSACGRLFGGLCNEICCSDPCYEPSWIAEANAAFFQDSPRPVTQTRIRWDAGFDHRFPDTSEFFWAKSPKGPAVTPAVRYHDLKLYQEIAASKSASVFTEISYRTIEPAIGNSGSGFGDMNVGVKTVLLDRELFLLTMQFTTFIPTGNFLTGIGTGHVSLEPAILAALKLGPATYLQTELAEWIPIGGTGGHASSVFHYHFSLNHNLLHWDCINVIGTVEFNGYCFNGAYTDPNPAPGGTVFGAGGRNYLNAGPGIRVQVCDHFDVGFAAAFGFGDRHGPGQLYRTEVRLRY